MPYAICSDIHGNIYALKAVLADAVKNGVDRFIFLGDYTSGFPWGEAVTETIRNLPAATVIRGNGEGYLETLARAQQRDFTLEQFKPVYWAYARLSDANLAYLLSLPANATITDGANKIHLQHAMDIFYRRQKISPFHSEKLRDVLDVPLSRQGYLDLARDALQSRDDAIADIRALPKGVYLFGHNHLQFHMTFEGRVFVNPGSCGEALDGDPTAAYTILACGREGWHISERRVSYDLDAVMKGFHDSGYWDYSPVWSRVMISELATGKDYSMRFVRHLIKTGRRIGKTDYPVANDVWHMAVKDLDISEL